jgi:hypothetical protein
MTRQLIRACFALLAGAVLAVAPAGAGQGAGASAHWKGAISLPQVELEVEIDLVAPKDGGAWTGTTNVPQQNIRALPLTGITVNGKAVTFAMKGVPGDPTFVGQLSDDGAAMTGDFTQGELKVPFKLARAGEAVVPPPPAKSTAITKEMEGTWAGILDVGGNTLRLTLKLASAADGTATGTLVSVDQGNAEIPVTTITQTGTHIEFSVATVSGSYKGDLKDGRLVGTWTQGPGSLPLEFARVP